MGSKMLLVKRMRRSAFFVVGCIISLSILLIVFLSPLYLQYSATKNSLTEKLLPPAWFSKGLEGHVLGTDQLGRDVLARLLEGGKLSFTISVVVVIIQVVTGTVLGMLAGYYGGVIDAIIMRVCDVVLSIPNLLLAIAVMAILGPSVSNLIAVLSFTGWVQFCKLTRNNVKIAKGMEYVHASKALGAKGEHIMLTQIFPNVTTHIIILSSQRVGWVILLESSLSFLNLGIPAPTPSWGNMISAGRNYLTLFPWLAFAPGVALMFTVLSFNFLGDGLRDVLDPKRT